MLIVAWLSMSHLFLCTIRNENKSLFLELILCTVLCYASHVVRQHEGRMVKMMALD